MKQFLNKKKLRPKGEDLLALQFGQLLFINKGTCFKKPGCLFINAGN